MDLHPIHCTRAERQKNEHRNDNYHVDLRRLLGRLNQWLYLVLIEAHDYPSGHNAIIDGSEIIWGLTRNAIDDVDVRPHCQ
jgi:hypothetical protein